jgi:hypothetical protein
MAGLAVGSRPVIPLVEVAYLYKCRFPIDKLAKKRAIPVDLLDGRPSISYNQTIMQNRGTRG